MNILDNLKAGCYPKDKNGDQVVLTRGGPPATINTWNYPGKYPILGLVNGAIRTWNKNGFSYENENAFSRDLLPPITTYKFNTCFVIHKATNEVVYLCTDADWDGDNLTKYRDDPKYTLLYRIMEGEVPPVTDWANQPSGPATLTTFSRPSRRTN